MVDKKGVVYSYHGIVKRQSYVIPRLLARLLRFEWFKRLFFSVPAIDESIIFKNGNSGTLYGEFDLSVLGVFKKNWDINYWLLNKLYYLPVYFNVIHGVYVPENYNPRFPWNKRQILDLTVVSAETQKALKKHVEVIDLLGKPQAKKVVVFHPVPYRLDLKKSQIISGIVKNLKAILPLLEEKNVYVALENMPYLRKPRTGYFPMLGSIEFFEDLFSELDHPHIGITFDWGHANSFARFMYETDQNLGDFEFTPEVLARFKYQTEFLTRLREKIFHLHLHYNEAHKLNKKPPRFFPNFDTHQPLTMLDYFEYENYKKNIRSIIDSENLISATLEIVPRAFAPARAYRSSIKVFEAMLK